MSDFFVELPLGHWRWVSKVPSSLREISINHLYSVLDRVFILARSLGSFRTTIYQYITTFKASNSRTRSRIIQSLNPLPSLSNHSLLCLSPGLALTITCRPNCKIQPTPQPHLLNRGSLRIRRGISGSDETPRFSQNRNASRDVPVSYEHRIPDTNAENTYHSQHPPSHQISKDPAAT
jgi:hypothetical protein